MNQFRRTIATGPEVGPTGGGLSWRKSGSVASVLLVGILLFGALTRPASAQCTGCTNASFGPTGHAYPFAAFNSDIVLASADFNGDGIPDVALLDRGSDFFHRPGGVTIFLGTGSGSLNAFAIYPVAGNPNALLAADMDGDGNLDLVVARYGSFDDTDKGGITVLLGNGSGGIRSSIDTPVGIHPYFLAAADLNGDGKIDVAAVGNEGPLEILPGDGHGGFGSPLLFENPSTSLGTVGVFDRLFVGDFNNDGIMDFGIATAQSFVAIYLGSGAGAFKAPLYVEGIFVGDVAVADLNRDGVLDLIVGQSVLLGTSDGHFVQTSILPPNPPSQVSAPLASPQAVGDFNQDGILDAIVNIGPPRGLAVAFGDGQGGFVLGPVLPSQFDQYTNPLVVADLDRDGRDDIAFFQYGNLGTVRGVGQGRFESPPEIELAAGLSIAPLAAADFTGDGINDIVGIGNDGGLYLLVSHADGTFDPPATIALLTANYSTLATADFNNDGKADIVAFVPGADAFSPNRLLIFFGDGSGHFSKPAAYPVNYGYPGYIATVDVNGDGRPDVIAFANGQIWLLPSRHNGFDSARVVLSGVSPNFRVADVNGDGKADIVTLGPAIQTYLGNGNGTFAAGPVSQPPTDATNFLIGDFDGDGKIDIGVMTTSPYYVYGFAALFGNGTGAFGSRLDLPPSVVAINPVSGNFLNDGRSELAFEGGNYVAFYRVDDSRQFHALGAFMMPSSFAPQLVADVTGDGKVDIIGLGYTSTYTIWVLPNTVCQPRRLSVSRNVSTCDVAGSPFATQPAVQAIDDGDNRITCLADAVTASIAPGTGTPGAVLGGTTSASIVNGVGSFTNLSVNLPGGGYRLLFSHPGSGATESREFSQSLPGPVITTPATVCTQDPNRYEAANGYDTYIWTLDGTVIGRSRILIIGNLSPGSHSLQLTVTRDGCSASSTTNIAPSNTPSPPVASSNGPVPWGGTIQLSSSSIPGATYLWTGPIGFTSSLQDPTVPNARPLVAGTYRVIASVAGCASSVASTVVKVVPPTWCAGCVSASFASAPHVFDAGSNLRSVTVGDFDGDGKPDVVVTHNTAPATVTFYPGTGHGSFGSGIDSLAPSVPQTSLPIDLNRDGLLDLVIGWYNGIAVLPGIGGGHFGAQQSFAPGLDVSEIMSGDFNEDGWPDLALLSEYAGTVTILLSDGAGGFLPGATYALGSFPRHLAVVDLNGDHHLDVVAFLAGTTSVAMLRGDGHGGFSRLPDFPAAAGTTEIALGDFDGDGLSDLALGIPGTLGSKVGTVSIWKGSGSGSFTSVRTITAGFQVLLRVKDLDGDGREDILFVGNGGLSVLRGQGAFNFDPVSAYPAGPQPLDFDFGDLDLDGRLDVVVGNGYYASSSLVILRGLGGGKLEKSPSAAVGTSLEGLVTGDFNQDGHLDVAVLAGPMNSYPYNVTVQVLLNDGTGSLSPGPTFLADRASTFLATTDFNGDGVPDLATNTGILLGDGAGGFSPLIPYPFPISGSPLVIGNFNGNVKRDVAIASNTTVFILLGDGIEDFTVAPNLTVVSSIVALAAADFNHDGRDDLAVVTNAGTVSIFLGDGSGGFQTGNTITLPQGLYYPVAIVAGDFDGDGKIDLVLAGDHIWILRGDGAGGFGSPAMIDTILGCLGLRAADFNGDGKLDLLVLPSNNFGQGATVDLYIGDGSGGFAPPTAYLSGGGGVGAEIADLDEDGRPDVLVANSFSGSVTTLFNTNCLARRLGATMSPVCPQPGALLSPTPVVKVFDDGANVVACDAGQVTASIAPGTGAPGAVLGGTTAVNAVAGSVNFGTLSIDRAGVGYQLEFHHPIATPARTTPFTVGSPPTPPTAGSNGPVCLGATLQLTASAVPGGVGALPVDGAERVYRHGAEPDDPQCHDGRRRRLQRLCECQRLHFVSLDNQRRRPARSIRRHHSAAVGLSEHAGFRRFGS